MAERDDLRVRRVHGLHVRVHGDPDGTRLGVEIDLSFDRASVPDWLAERDASRGTVRFRSATGDAALDPAFAILIRGKTTSDQEMRVEGEMTEIPSGRPLGTAQVWAQNPESLPVVHAKGEEHTILLGRGLEPEPLPHAVDRAMPAWSPLGE